MRPFRFNGTPNNMLECSLKLRPVSLAEMPNPSVNDAVGGLINHYLCHDDAMVRDWWRDGRCRAIRHVRQNRIKKIIVTSRFMHTLRDAFGYTNVLKDLTNANPEHPRLKKINRQILDWKNQSTDKWQLSIDVFNRQIFSLKRSADWKNQSTDKSADWKINRQINLSIEKINRQINVIQDEYVFRYIADITYIVIYCIYRHI